MKIRETITVNLVFEDYELPQAMLFREWYKAQGFKVANEFLEIPKGEQGYVVLAKDTVLKKKRK